MEIWRIQDGRIGIGLYDFVLAPIYIAILLWIGSYIKKRNPDFIGSRYVIPAISIKLFSVFAFGMVYQYVYGGGGRLGGDTATYFQGSYAIYKSIFFNPITTIKLIMINDLDWWTTSSPDMWYFMIYFDHLDSQEQVFMYRFGFFPVLLGLGAYIPASFCLAFFMFLGSWKVYKIYCNQFPGREKHFAIAFFFIPSLCFWGSALMRDTASIACLMWVYYLLHCIFFKKKNIIINFILIFILCRAIFHLKAYVLLTFLPPYLGYIYIYNIKFIKGPFARVIVGFFLLIFLSVAGYFAFKSMANSSEKYQLANLEKQLEGFHSYHTYLSDKGISKSGYTIQIDDFSAGSIIKALPAAINVALFRPYIWESRSPLILLSAIESLIVMIFFIRLFLKVGFINFFINLKVPEVFFGILYAIVLGAACGMTAFNFGALVRFKIPMLPFLFAALMIVEFNYNKNKEAKKLSSNIQ